MHSKPEKLDLDDSLKENCPPDGETKNGPSTRPTSGVLVPSTNVRSVPLEIQEAVLDEDERRQERELFGGDEGQEPTEQATSSFEKMPPPPVPGALPLTSKQNNPNVTIALPSMEAFEEMAHVVSTPYHGRRNFDDDYDDDDCKLDENTCAVQIVFKKPSSAGNTKSDKSDPQTPNKNVPEQQQHSSQDSQLPPNPCPLLLSPIMETSREYKSSSTSSGQSLMTSQHALTKSHWGNTHLGTTTMSNARTPGSVLTANSVGKTQVQGEMTCSSGYMADSSSARTPGQFLIKSRGGDFGQEEEEEAPKTTIGKRNEESPKKSVQKKQRMNESYEVSLCDAVIANLALKIKQNCRKKRRTTTWLV